MVWLGVIFFSSTSLAARWAGHAFDAAWTLMLEKWLTGNLGYNSSNFLAEKGLHITMFATLGILLWNLIPRNPRRVWLIMLAGILIGSASEFYQSFFVGRDPAVRDVLLNAAGTALGILLAAAVSTAERFRQERA